MCLGRSAVVSECRKTRVNRIGGCAYLISARSVADVCGESCINANKIIRTARIDEAAGANEEVVRGSSGTCALEVTGDNRVVQDEVFTAHLAYAAAIARRIAIGVCAVVGNRDVG